MHPPEEVDDERKEEDCEGHEGGDSENNENGCRNNENGCQNNEKDNKTNPNQLSSLVNSYKFTNQILVQQVNEWKAKYQKCEDKVSESEKSVKRLEEEKQALLKENEEMRAALSQTDLTDYQFIDDSSQES